MASSPLSLLDNNSQSELEQGCLMDSFSQFLQPQQLASPSHEVTMSSLIKHLESPPSLNLDNFSVPVSPTSLASGIHLDYFSPAINTHQPSSASDENTGISGPVSHSLYSRPSGKEPSLYGQDTPLLFPESDIYSPETALTSSHPPSPFIPSPDDLHINILGIPDEGAKSRVETQIKLSIQLLTKDGAKATAWPYLRLPEKTLAKSKLRKHLDCSYQDERAPALLSDESKVLTLEARVICESDPAKKVTMCVGCVRRERKRAERKRVSRSEGAQRLAMESRFLPERDTISSTDTAFEKDRERILLFSCDPLVTFSSGEITLPIRITCYCRHHRERVGFRVLFAMRDYMGNIIATGESPSIMITDDHKSLKAPVEVKKRDSTEAELSCAPMRPTKQPETLPALKTLSANTSPLVKSTPLPTCRPAKKPRTNKAMPPPIDIRPVNLTCPPSNIPLSLNVDTPISLVNFSGHPVFNALKLDNLQIETPRMELIVPARGPTYGGTEVTILGSGFSHDLTCYFGDQAAATLYWSATTLVCVLPPSVQSGPVPVTFRKKMSLEYKAGHFEYYTTDDQAFMELALQVVGIKMTGRIQDAKQIAMHVIQDDSPQSIENQSRANLAKHIRQRTKTLETNTTAWAAPRNGNGISPQIDQIRNVHTDISQSEWHANSNGAHAGFYALSKLLEEDTDELLANWNPINTMINKQQTEPGIDTQALAALGTYNGLDDWLMQSMNTSEMTSPSWLSPLSCPSR
ncbi:hypothetical protein CLU79DRAFT_837450 [Phycomyces nitens]|nr:hypothetical protein CLU79DRAFT_837450 [Phycomyces nitens]